MKKSIILIACFLFISLRITYAQDSCIQNNTNKLDSICRVVFQQWNLPGMAVVVIQDGKEVLLKGYGKTSYEGNGQKVTPQTQFVIASTSKAMTSALLATLVQKGDVKWGDTVKNHLPGFKLYDPWVTQNFLVKDIMVHKTGFRAYATDDLPHFGYDRDQIFTLLRHIQPTYSFRTTYAYNNAMYTVAAKIIEKYYGTSWDDAISKYLFEPLEMTSSTTGNKAYFNNPRLAQGYRHFKDGDSIKFEPRKDKENAFRWLSAVAPAGFVITTAADMGNWLRMHLDNGQFKGKQFLSKETHNMLFFPQTVTGTDSSAIYNYAQGWTIEAGLNGKMIRHTWLAYGYTALVTILPEQKLGIAILTNAGNTTNPHMAIAREISEFFAGTDKRDWNKHYLEAFMKDSPRQNNESQKDSIAPKRLDLYSGEFGKEDFGIVKITMEDGSLVFNLNNVKSPLRHKNGDIFTMNVPGAGNIEVEFFPGTNIPIESLTFKIGDPIGKFYRKQEQSQNN